MKKLLKSKKLRNIKVVKGALKGTTSPRGGQRGHTRGALGHCGGGP